MHKPERYQSLSNSLIEITRRILNKHYKQVKLIENKLITAVDIGCGSGETTRNVLYPLLKNNLKTLVGVDVSSEMTDFANDNFSNSKLLFVKCDITSEQQISKYQNYFNCVFSFWCLHWISNQEHAFSNIWKVMSPGSNMLVALASSSNIFDVFKKVRSSASWLCYLKEKDHAISPYNDSPNTCSKLKQLLQKIGFKVDICELDEGILKFDDHGFEDYLITTHPFYETLPNDLKETFIKDHKIEMIKSNFVEYNTDKNFIYVINFKIVIIYAQKLDKIQ